MIPSTVYTTTIGKVLVTWLREWHCKRDTNGRRIRGTSQAGPVKGLVLARYNNEAVKATDIWIDRQEFPASKNHREAVEEYVNARTDLKA